MSAVFRHIYRDAKTGAWKKTRTWYIRYSVDGKAHMEPSHSTKRADAARLLAQRQHELKLLAKRRRRSKGELPGGPLGMALRASSGLTEGASGGPEEQERARKWGPFRVVAKVLKADHAPTCSRVRFVCGHEATVWKSQTKRARCSQCRASRSPRSSRRPRRYAKHGLIALQHAVRTLGDRAIDPQTPVGRALTRWRSELLGDLGGPESVSTQQLAIVDVAVRTKLILDSVDAWLLAQPTLVHHRTRSLWPVVWQRQRIADGFTRALLGLGLERRTKGVDLARVLAEPHPRESDDRLELERAVSSTNTDDRLDVDDESDDRSSTSARSTDPA